MANSVNVLWQTNQLHLERRQTDRWTQLLGASQRPVNILHTCTIIGVNFLTKLGAHVHGERRERKPITGVWGGAKWPQRVPGRAAGQGEAESISSFRSANEAQIYSFLLSFKLLKYTF